MSVITLTKEESLDNNSVVQISPTATSARRSPLDFKAKLLRHLISKRTEGGFTMIELLVVIIIIGILAAIALPSYLNQVNKGKQAEAKQYMGAMNRSQEAYYLEQGSFATDIDQLGLGIKKQTENYDYSVTSNYDLSFPISQNNAMSRKKGLFSYLTLLRQIDGTPDAIFDFKGCTSKKAVVMSSPPPVPVIIDTDPLYCPIDYNP